ncbi:CDGSH iron-sulfur domain-containing protein [Nocardia sp. BMG51109]|uniref:CDGSH iron-sulfur domain-containing protein n=1 Tax=Nocardia sp. BMG51109 TaxID=1056816 RepID=UPI000561AE32
MPRERGARSERAAPTECGAPDEHAVDRRRVTLTADGPALIEGPVELVTADGTTIRCDRFVVAVCTCRRSRSYPLCDTSHRRHRRAPRG